MFSLCKLLYTLLIFALVATAAPSTELERHRKCYKGPYIIIAHGTNEVGKASMGYVSDQVELQIPNSHTVAIHYPSTMDNYPHSEGTGVFKMKRKIRQYVEMCGHEAKIMLLGYSQGAHVITDTLSGGTFEGSGRKGNEFSKPLPEYLGRHIHAVLQFGDPSFTAHKSWDAGTSTNSGVVTLSTDQLTHFNSYSAILRSYCDNLDPYCASGEKNKKGFTVHSSYVQNYGLNAANWLVKMWSTNEKRD